MAMPKLEKIAEIQAATVITAAEIVIGAAINIAQANTMIIYVDYVNGDETSYDLIPKFLKDFDGDEHPDCTWSGAAGIRTVTADKYRMTADGKYFITLDVRGHRWVKLYGDATAGTPTGTAQIGYSLSSD